MTSTTITDRAGLYSTLAVKSPVIAVTTANRALSGLDTGSLTLGTGVAALTDSDRVLVNAQNDASENGIYNPSSGTWVRARDFDGARDVVKGTLIPFATTGGLGALYQVTSETPVIGTDDIAISLLDDPLRVIPLSQGEIDAGVVPTAYGFEWGDVRRYGADDTAATVSQNNFGTDFLTGHVVSGEGDYKWADGVAVPEGGRMEMSGGGRGVAKTSIELTGSGAQKGIYSDGTFVVPGFDSRRGIVLNGFEITDDESGTPDALIDLHFATFYEIADVAIVGRTSTIGLSLTNCFEGTVRRVHIQSEAVGNASNPGVNMDTGLLFTNDPADSVFTGQTLFEDIYVKFVQNAGNTGTGIEINRQINVMAHLEFSKCHVHQCDIGMHLVDCSQGPTINTMHFEANLVSDFIGDADSPSPTFINCFCNNAVTTGVGFDINGHGGGWHGGKIINFDGGSDMLGLSGTGFVVDQGAIFRLAAGDSATAVHVYTGAEGNVIRDIVLEGSTAWADAIVIDAGAVNTVIGAVHKPTVNGDTVAGAVVTNNGTGTIYENSTTVKSALFDLSSVATQASEDSHRSQAGFVNRAWVLFQDAGGANTGVINIGIPGTATKFVNAYNPPNTAAGTLIDISAQINAAQNAIAATDTLRMAVIGNGADTGTVYIIVEITPFRAER